MSDPVFPDNPFTQLILDFKGKEIPSDHLEFDSNNTLNYPNNSMYLQKAGMSLFIPHLGVICFC
jgi:hypothetical protein